MQWRTEIVRTNELTFATLRVLEAVNVQEAVLAGQQQARLLLQLRHHALVPQPRLRQLYRRVRPVLRKHVRHHVRRQVAGDGLRQKAHTPTAGGRPRWIIATLRLIVIARAARAGGRRCGRIDRHALAPFRLLDRFRIDPEDMYGFGVRARDDKARAGAEVQRADADVPLDAPPELVHPLAVLHAEHANHGALLRGGRQQQPVVGEVQCGQRRIVRLQLQPAQLVGRVEDLQLATVGRHRVGQVGQQRERAQAARVRRHVLDGM